MNGSQSLFHPKTVSLFLLLLALLSMFLFGNERHTFYRPGHHNYVSAEHFRIAKNLSPHHNFLMFDSRTLKADGSLSYHPYNRFPIGSYALIKLATLPFDGSLAAEIYTARILMLLFFCAAAVLAYVTLCRLTFTPLIALTATLIPFSSYYSLYYNDMIHPKASMDLFGVLLVFYGMVIFVQDGRFFQLLVKTCAALLVGWHVYALLLPFIFLGLARAVIKGPRLFRQPNRFCRPYVLLGAVSLLLGVVILTFNFTNEYFALNGKRGLTELPSYRSLQRRMGMNQRFNVREAHIVAWGPFLEEEFRRIGQMSLPYAMFGAVGTLNDDGTPQEGGRRFVIIGIAMSVTCLIGLARGRSSMLLTPLVLSGFCWALPMRHDTAFHDFEALFYVGIPLVFFSQVLGWIHRRFGVALIAGLAVAATLCFLLSSLLMNRVGHDAEAAEFSEKTMADFEVIRRLTNGKKVLNAWPGGHRGNKLIPQLNYYLAGSIFYHHSMRRKLQGLPFDFIITHLRVEGANLLTPENRLIFAYKWDDDFFDAYRSRSFGRLLVRSNFDVYLDGTVLRYVKNPCSREDWNAEFFLHVIPVDVEDLPDHSGQYQSEMRNFLFGDYRRDLGIDGTCEAVVPLPEYAIARIRTGQFIPNGRRIWEETFSLADDPLSSARKESSPLEDHPRSAES